MDKIQGAFVGLLVWAFGLVCVAAAMAVSLFFTGLVITLAQWWVQAVFEFFGV